MLRRAVDQIGTGTAVAEVPSGSGARRKTKEKCGLLKIGEKEIGEYNDPIAIVQNAGF